MIQSKTDHCRKSGRRLSKSRLRSRTLQAENGTITLPADELPLGTVVVNFTIELDRYVSKTDRFVSHRRLMAGSYPIEAGGRRGGGPAQPDRGNEEEVEGEEEKRRGGEEEEERKGEEKATRRKRGEEESRRESEEKEEESRGREVEEERRRRGGRNDEDRYVSKRGRFVSNRRLMNGPHRHEAPYTLNEDQLREQEEIKRTQNLLGASATETVQVRNG